MGIFDLAKSSLKYDPETGRFHRLLVSGGVASGEIKNLASADGYIAIGLAGKKYKAHRLAWLLTYGQWPKEEIDHINGDKVDNRLCNLRDVPKSKNMQNKRAAHAGSVSRLLGAYKDGTRWRSHIKTDGAVKYLGSYASKEEAHAAYCVAKESLHKVRITAGPGE